MIAFDASDLHWDDTRLPLHLSLPLLVNNEPPVVPLPVPTGPATNTPTQVPPASHVITFDFSFDTAYDAREVMLEPRQEVESNGVKMTLDRVDVTASEARVSVRFSESRPESFLDDMDWVAMAKLLVRPGPDEKGLSLLAEPEWVCYAGMDECVFTFVSPYLMGVAPSDCTLIISAGQNAPKYFGGAPPPDLSDWGFDFRVPASSEK